MGGKGSGWVLVCARVSWCGILAYMCFLCVCAYVKCGYRLSFEFNRRFPFWPFFLSISLCLSSSPLPLVAQRPLQTLQRECRHMQARPQLNIDLPCGSKAGCRKQFGRTSKQIPERKRKTAGLSQVMAQMGRDATREGMATERGDG